MLQKLRRPLPAFVAVAIIVFLLLYGTLVVASCFLLPPLYLSVARMEISQPLASGTREVQPADPYFLQTQFEIIMSSHVLSTVVSNLNLTQIYNQQIRGEPMTESDILNLLRRHTQIKTQRSAKHLTEVWEYDLDKNLAAQIANEIAVTYQKTRGERHVEIVDLAEPARKPIAPNRTRNLVLGFPVSLLIASAAGGIAALFTMLFQRRLPKPPVGATR